MLGEFDFIEKYLVPLAGEGALSLKDDAACIRPPKGCELVITKDALVEGVHFIGTEPPDLIARKLLRVNLSDLAAKGAEPLGYLLALMLPEKVDEAWLAMFCEGLKTDQEGFGITLLGGDTTSTPGSLTLSLTALGMVPEGNMLKRSGAKTGDRLYVSGKLGEACAGLKLLQEFHHPIIPSSHHLQQRYLLPEPRLKLGKALGGIATACMDISDGLIQDASHLAKASGVKLVIQADRVPVETSISLEEALIWGDDYELLFTVPPAREAEMAHIAAETGMALTCIGEAMEGRGVVALDLKGAEIVFKKSGFQHFLS